MTMVSIFSFNNVEKDHKGCFPAYLWWTKNTYLGSIYVINVLHINILYINILIRMFVVNLLLIITYFTLSWGSLWLFSALIKTDKCHSYYRNQFKKKRCCCSGDEENRRGRDVWRDGLKKYRNVIYWVTAGFWKQHDRWYKSQTGKRRRQQ